MKIVLLVCVIGGLIMVTSTSVYGQTEWYNDCDIKCVNGQCNAIFGKSFHANDGTGCKDVREIKDLSKVKKFLVKKSEDGIHGLDLISFNTTCVVLKPYAKNALYEFNKDIPLKYHNKEQMYVNIPNQLALVPKITICPENGSFINYSFGKASTSILISDDNGFLHDNYVYAGSGSGNYPNANQNYWRDHSSYAFRSYIKWDITALPALGTINITNATLEYYLDYDDSDDGVQVYEVTDNWHEDIITWDNQPCGSTWDSIGGTCNSTPDADHVSTGSINFSLEITSTVVNSFYTGDDNVSVVLANFGDDNQPADGFKSKNNNGGYFLNITYDVGCSPSWTNTSCNISDQLLEWDTNYCGVGNTTYSCNYCSYNITNTSWTNWVNVSSCNVSGNITQNRTRIEYDSNHSTCCAITGLGSDCYTNVTYTQTQIADCIYTPPNPPRSAGLVQLYDFETDIEYLFMWIMMSENMTLSSPDGSLWSCGVSNTGGFSCTSY